MMKESKEKGLKFKARELCSRALQWKCFDTIINLVLVIVEYKANQESLQGKLGKKVNRKLNKILYIKSMLKVIEMVMYNHL